MTESASRKRPRISQACESCAKRKTRCGGERPACLACRSRGIASTCVYEHKDPQSSRATTSSSCTSPRKTKPGNISQSEILDAGNGLALHQSDSADTDARTDDAESTIAGVSWTSPEGAGIGTLAGGYSKSLYYGSSSTVSFFAEVASNSRYRSRTDTSANGMAKTRREQTKNENRSKQTAITLQSRQRNLVMLPARRTADSLLSTYWRFIHPVVPVLYRPEFDRQYEELWLPHPQSDNQDLSELDDDGIFVATLNIVFALGCKLSNEMDPAQKVSTSEEFMQRSRQFYQAEFLDGESVGAVQMLILMSCYLHATRYGAKAWNSLGLAIRIAQGLGMHTSSKNGAQMSQLETELTRRIWYTCVFLDGIFAIGTGRPRMIPKTHGVPMPAMIDDEYLCMDGEGVQPPGKPSVLSLFLSSCRLFTEVYDVAHSLNFNNELAIDGRLQELAMRMLSINKILDEFVKSLPSHLQFTRSGDFVKANNEMVELQQKTLYLRKDLDLMNIGSEDDVIEQDIISKFCNICLKTAYRLIDAAESNLGTPNDCYAWHVVHFTFTAAINLIAALNCDFLGVQAGDENLEIHWSSALKIFAYYETQIPSSKHAAQMLRIGRDRLCGPHSQSRSDDTTSASRNRRQGAEEDPVTPMQSDLDSVSLPNWFDSGDFDLDAMMSGWNDSLADIDWGQMAVI